MQRCRHKVIPSSLLLCWAMMCNTCAPMSGTHTGALALMRSRWWLQTILRGMWCPCFVSVSAHRHQGQNDIKCWQLCTAGHRQALRSNHSYNSHLSFWVRSIVCKHASAILAVHMKSGIARFTMDTALCCNQQLVDKCLQISF